MQDERNQSAAQSQAEELPDLIRRCCTSAPGQEPAWISGHKKTTSTTPASSTPVVKKEETCQRVGLVQHGPSTVPKTTPSNKATPVYRRVKRTSVTGSSLLVDAPRATPGFQKRFSGRPVPMKTYPVKQEHHSTTVRGPWTVRALQGSRKSWVFGADRTKESKKIHLQIKKEKSTKSTEELKVFHKQQYLTPVCPWEVNKNLKPGDIVRKYLDTDRRWEVRMGTQNISSLPGSILTGLPTDIRHQIFSLLGWDDFFSLMGTCKEFRHGVMRGKTVLSQLRWVIHRGVVEQGYKNFQERFAKGDTFEDDDEWMETECDRPFSRIKEAALMYILHLMVKNPPTAGVGKRSLSIQFRCMGADRVSKPAADFLNDLRDVRESDYLPEDMERALGRLLRAKHITPEESEKLYFYLGNFISGPPP